MDANNVHPVGRVAHIRVLTTKTGFSTCTRIVTATVKRENKFRPFCRVLSGVSIRVLGPLRPVGEDQCEPRKTVAFAHGARTGRGAWERPFSRGLHAICMAQGVRSASRYPHGSRGPLRFPPSARLKRPAPLPAIRMTQEARSAFRHPRFFS